MSVSNAQVKILVSDREINFNKEEIESLVYYSSGDVVISAVIDGKKEELNIVNMNMTNIRLFLANWIEIKNDPEKIMNLFVVVKNLAKMKDSNNIVNLSKIIAESEIGLLSFTNYEEFGKTLLTDPDIDNSNLLDNGIIEIDRKKLKEFLKGKVEASQAVSWSDSKIIQRYPDALEEIVKVKTTEMANYIDTQFYVFKSAKQFYIINKLDV